MPVIFVYVTAADVDEAKTIGRKLVEEQLAACANILPGATSIFRWQGKLEEAKVHMQKALKGAPQESLFHSNLALAYFTAKDTNSARKELDRALRLDPNLLSHTNESGYNLQISSSLS